MRTGRMAVCVAGMILLLASGCELFPEGWRSGKQKDIKIVKPGWTVNDVVIKVGKPTRQIQAEGLKLGWEEWIYPTGSIFFYRFVVKYVVPRSEETAAPRPIRDRARWPVEVGEGRDDIKPKSEFGDF